MSVASSEEITAALEVAIKSCEWAGYEYPAEEEKQNAAAVTLRAHLSRLREEAEFRDAARDYVAWCETSNREIAEIDTGKTFAWINRLGELQHALRLAYRALEEPRDAD